MYIQLQNHLYSIHITIGEQQLFLLTFVSNIFSHLILRVTQEVDVLY